jgi:hypothetical protein
LAAVRASGFPEANYYYAIDRTSNVAYSYYVKPTQGGEPPIQIWRRPNELREVTDVSVVVQAIASERVTRNVLFVPREAEQAVDQVLAH